MLFRGRKDDKGWGFTADLLPKPVAWLLGVVAVLVFAYMMWQGYFLPNNETTVELPGKGLVKTRPFGQPQADTPLRTEPYRTEPKRAEPFPTEPQRSEPPQRAEPRPDPAPMPPPQQHVDIDPNLVEPSMDAREFPKSVVPVPKSRPYGYFYVRLKELGSGDGEWTLIPVPCDLDRPLPRACFVHPDLRKKKKYAVTQSYFKRR